MGIDNAFLNGNGFGNGWGDSGFPDGRGRGDCFFLDSGFGDGNRWGYKGCGAKFFNGDENGNGRGCCRGNYRGFDLSLIAPVNNFVDWCDEPGVNAKSE